MATVVEELLSGHPRWRAVDEAAEAADEAAAAAQAQATDESANEAAVDEEEADEAAGDKVEADESAMAKGSSSGAASAQPLQILDIGGSKGFLAQHLADHFGRRVNVSVVDIDPKRVANGAARAARRGVRRSTADAPANNLHFVAGDAAALSARGVLPDADLVLGLHACGGLSDLIIAHAVTHGAAFAVCPCCYLTNRALDVPCAPLADAHDTRTGTLSRDEWLVAGVDDGAATRFSHAALRTLLRAAEQNDDPSTAELGARSVNALRAAAAQRHWAHGRPHGATPKLSVELRAFDARYSAKNCVLVGRPEPLSPKTEQDAEQGKAA